MRCRVRTIKLLVSAIPLHNGPNGMHRPVRIYKYRLLSPILLISLHSLSILPSLITNLSSYIVKEQWATQSMPISMTLELEAVGYKREMPRQFSLWSLGTLSFMLTCAWLGSSLGELQIGANQFWSMSRNPFDTERLRALML
jgi:hypothetical protein